MLPPFRVRGILPLESANPNHVDLTAATSAARNPAMVATAQTFHPHEVCLYKDGHIRMRKDEYEKLLEKQPRAALRYFDEDDGEVVLVGSVLELEQRLREPVQVLESVSSESQHTEKESIIGRSQGLHAFDIDREQDVLDVWKAIHGRSQHFNDIIRFDNWAHGDVSFGQTSPLIRNALKATAAQAGNSIHAQRWASYSNLPASFDQRTSELASGKRVNDEKYIPKTLQESPREESPEELRLNTYLSQSKPRAQEFPELPVSSSTMQFGSNPKQEKEYPPLLDLFETQLAELASSSSSKPNVLPQLKTQNESLGLHDLKVPRQPPSLSQGAQLTHAELDRFKQQSSDLQVLNRELENEFNLVPLPNAAGLPNDALRSLFANVGNLAAACKKSIAELQQQVVRAQQAIIGDLKDAIKANVCPQESILRDGVKPEPLMPFTASSNTFRAPDYKDTTSSALESSVNEPSPDMQASSPMQIILTQFAVQELQFNSYIRRQRHSLEALLDKQAWAFSEHLAHQRTSLTSFLETQKLSQQGIDVRNEGSGDARSTDPLRSDHQKLSSPRDQCSVQPASSAQNSISDSLTDSVLNALDVDEMLANGGAILPNNVSTTLPKMSVAIDCFPSHTKASGQQRGSEQPTVEPPSVDINPSQEKQTTSEKSSATYPTMMQVKYGNLKAGPIRALTNKKQNWDTLATDPSISEQKQTPSAVNQTLSQIEQVVLPQSTGKNPMEVQGQPLACSNIISPAAVPPDSPADAKTQSTIDAFKINAHLTNANDKEEKEAWDMLAQHFKPPISWPTRQPLPAVHVSREALEDFQSWNLSSGLSERASKTFEFSPPAVKQPRFSVKHSPNRSRSIRLSKSGSLAPTKFPTELNSDFDAFHQDAEYSKTKSNTLKLAGLVPSIPLAVPVQNCPQEPVPWQSSCLSDSFLITRSLQIGPDPNEKSSSLRSSQSDKKTSGSDKAQKIFGNTHVINVTNASAGKDENFAPVVPPKPFKLQKASKPAQSGLKPASNEPKPAGVIKQELLTPATAGMRSKSMNKDEFSFLGGSLLEGNDLESTLDSLLFPKTVRSSQASAKQSLSRATSLDNLAGRRYPNLTQSIISDDAYKLSAAHPALPFNPGSHPITEHTLSPLSQPSTLIQNPNSTSTTAPHTTPTPHDAAPSTSFPIFSPSTTTAERLCATQLIEMGFPLDKAEMVSTSVGGDLDKAIEVFEEDQRIWHNKMKGKGRSVEDVIPGGWDEELYG